MLKNLKKELSAKEKIIVGGVFYGIKIKGGYFFPLSGVFISRKRKVNGKLSKDRE